MHILNCTIERRTYFIKYVFVYVYNLFVYLYNKHKKILVNITD